MFMRIFEQFDTDNSGTLEYTEFAALVASNYLDLKLSGDEIKNLFELADEDHSGTISTAEFANSAKLLLQKVATEATTDLNDWVKLEDPSGAKKAMYLNKRTWATQRTPPQGYNPKRVEEYVFDNLVLDDGTEVTTYTKGDGVTMYMDWDTGEWREIPGELLEELWETQEGERPQTGQSRRLVSAEEGVDGDDGYGGYNFGYEDEDEDPRIGEFTHPVHGTVSTYLLENTRNSRVYFDEGTGQWARMPLSWERSIPQVQSLLLEMDNALPQWGNVNEQLMGLRECNYNLDEAVEYGRTNFGYGNGEEGADHKKGKMSKMQRSVGRFNSSSSLASPNITDVEDLGKLSAKAAARIDNLEQLVMQLRGENQRMRSDDDTQDGRRSASLRTADLKRMEMLYGKAQNQITELHNKLKRQREETVAMEQQLIALRDTAGRVTELEAAVERKYPAESLQEALTRQLDEYRRENIRLQAQIGDKARIASMAIGKQAIDLTKVARKHTTQLHVLNDGLRAKYVGLRSEMEGMISKALRTTRVFAQHSQKAVDGITAKYRAEVMQRKLLYNKIQELRGNIRVFLRCRKDPYGSLRLYDPITMPL